MNLIESSVRRPVTVTMLIGVMLVVGLMSWMRLGLDLMPDVDFPTISLVTRYEGAGSEDIEKRITRPIEGAVSTVQNVVGVKSFSQEDVSFVMVEFEWGTDLDSAAMDLREALGLLGDALPEGAAEPLVVKFSLGTFPVLGYGVSGMGGDLVALQEYLKDALLPRLERLDGVAQAVLMGGPEREVQIDLDRQALEASGIPLEQVVQGIAAQNVEQPAGRVVHHGDEFSLRTTGEYGDIEQIGEVVVGFGRSGAPLRVRDLGTVEMGVVETRNKTRTGGADSLILFLNKQSGANPLEVSRRVKAELETVRKELPSDIAFSIIMDTGSQIELMSSGLTESAVVGGLLAILFMHLFLRSARPTFAIGVAIPLSVLATFIPMYATGETLNLMTMGGLMLGIGMLVDNSVVIIENIFRHLEMGASRKEAAERGTKEMGLAIVASTATSVVVFLPLWFGSGLAGELVRGLAIVVAFSQVVSLLIAVTIVPSIAGILFNASDAKRASAQGGRFLRFRNGYARLLRSALDHKGRLIASMVAATALAGVGIARVGTDFLPKSDQPLVMGKIKFPVGTPMEKTDLAGRTVERFLLSLPDIETVGVSTGVNEDDLGAGLSEFSPTGPHEAQIWVRLLQDRSMSQSELMERMRQGVPKIEGLEVEFLDMGQAMMGGGASKPIEVKVFGDEFDTLARIAAEVGLAIDEVEGVDDVDNSLKEGVPERHLVVDREKAASFGLTVAEVARAVEAATQGLPAGLFRKAGEEYLLRVRYEGADRATLDEVERIRVPTRAGYAVPLLQVTRFEGGVGPVRITREDQSRRVSVRAALTGGRDLGSAVKDIEAALGPVRKGLPLGYRIEFGGTFEQMAEAFTMLMGGLLLAFLLVYMVMAAEFEAFLHPFVIMATVPLSLIGVALGHGVTGTPVTAVTFVGFIVLTGIVVNNGIVLVDRINELRREGVERRQAIIEGCTTRVRPVLITAGATVAGLLPAILVPPRGTELIRDLSIAIAGGLTASTLLTLLTIPALYELVDSWGARIKDRLVRGLHGDEGAVELEAPSEEAPPQDRAETAARLATT